ncbi:hypothetical protein [Frondihabitans peucedani]
MSIKSHIEKAKARRWSKLEVAGQPAGPLAPRVGLATDLASGLVLILTVSAFGWVSAHYGLIALAEDLVSRFPKSLDRDTAGEWAYAAIWFGAWGLGALFAAIWPGYRSFRRQKVAVEIGRLVYERFQIDFFLVQRTVAVMPIFPRAVGGVRGPWAYKMTSALDMLNGEKPQLIIVVPRHKGEAIRVKFVQPAANGLQAHIVPLEVRTEPARPLQVRSGWRGRVGRFFLTQA